MRKFILIMLNLCLYFNAEAQESKEKGEVFGDILMGPYLFVQHIPYDAVMMQGARLGCRFPAGIGLAAEYLVGHQTDINNNYGLTHQASVEVLLLGNTPPKRIKPYGMLGMGFLEFKSFTQDKYGIAYHVAAGIEIEYSPKIKGFIEPRYLNISQMDLGGQHELVVTWGVRFAFSNN